MRSLLFLEVFSPIIELKLSKFLNKILDYPDILVPNSVISKENYIILFIKITYALKYLPQNF